MKVYGTAICIDCRNFKALKENRGMEDIQYIDITENTDNLRAFLGLRDTMEAFQSVKEHGGIGIPCFVKEDGTVSFDVNEALSWIGQEPVKEEEIVERREETCSSCS